MSSGTTIILDGSPASPDVELEAFMPNGGSGSDGGTLLLHDKKRHRGSQVEEKRYWLFHHIVQTLEERTNLKLLLRVWGPRLEFVVRLMLVATFLDDTISTSMQFSEHSEEVAKQGCLQWFAATLSPELINVIATVVLGIGILAQSVGSICLLALVQPNNATILLISWTIMHPVLYAQLSNFEFVAASFSLIGGLLLLRAHIVSEASANTQLLGRMLLPALYLYYAGLFLISALTREETSSLATYITSLSIFVFYTVVIFGFVIGSTLVAAGLKSRAIAFLLAMVNLAYVFYRHPFFRYIWLQDGEWKYDEDNMPMATVALPTGVLPNELEAWQVYNLHKYYFFLGLSSSGALLLLAQFGPGAIAIQKDEVLLPYVARGQD